MEVKTLDMTELMNIIDGVRRGKNLTQEKFAGKVGLTLSTYNRQKQGDLRVGLDAIRLYAGFAVKHNESEMLNALGAYALDIPDDKIKVG